MRILKGKLETWAIDRPIPHPDNANHGDVGAIAQSIAKNGFYGRLLIQKSTGYIVQGNHRYAAAKQVGLKEIPVEVFELTDLEAKRLMVADNRTARLGQDDPDALRDLLESIQKEDSLEGTGYTDDDLEQLLHDLDNDFDEPDVDPPDAKEQSQLASKEQPKPAGRIVPFMVEMPQAVYERFQAYRKQDKPQKTALQAITALLDLAESMEPANV